MLHYWRPQMFPMRCLALNLAQTPIEKTRQREGMLTRPCLAHRELTRAKYRPDRLPTTSLQQQRLLLWQYIDEKMKIFRRLRFFYTDFRVNRQTAYSKGRVESRRRVPLKNKTSTLYWARQAELSFGRPKEDDLLRLRRPDRTMEIWRRASFFSLAVVAEVFTLTGKNTETKYRRSWDNKCRQDISKANWAGFFQTILQTSVFR